MSVSNWCTNGVVGPICLVDLVLFLTYLHNLPYKSSLEAVCVECVLLGLYHLLRVSDAGLLVHRTLAMH